jgi:uncharacterized protein (TIGR03435 family)
MSAATLRMLLQNAYQRPSTTGPVGPIQIFGGPSWMDSDRYDIQATADCSGGVLSREQVQLMVQSMLEDRFQLKAHLETRELPIYNLVVGKDGPKLKASADQTLTSIGAATLPLPCNPASVVPPPPPPPPIPRGPDGRGGLSDPNFAMPRGAMGLSFSPAGFAIRGAAVPITNLVNALQQQLGRSVIDKTSLKGLFDFNLQFSPEGLTTPGGGVLPPPPPGATATDPLPSIFTAIQEVGLRLESTKGPVEVLVVDSAQKPTEN